MVTQIPRGRLRVNQRFCLSAIDGMVQRSDRTASLVAKNCAGLICQRSCLAWLCQPAVCGPTALLGESFHEQRTINVSRSCKRRGYMGGSARLNVARFHQVTDGERRRGRGQVRGPDRPIRGRWGITAPGEPQEPAQRQGIGEAPLQAPLRLNPGGRARPRRARSTPATGSSGGVPSTLAGSFAMGALSREPASWAGPIDGVSQ